ncbi:MULTISPECIES: antitoxin YezG family protein [Bacillus]|uniref:Antitoxin YezG family protein n=1 Tax=Bacillus rugosus TaxID=2715209 RepID=A0ACD4A180_9BACI|nr:MULTISPECIES: antitoxin YezG family protein [Bacillus]MBY4605707.1 antitoxin YezG family protein [Bacillus sp. SPARC3]NUF04173.1 antitoxin YezG family protein [Bacillus rugosus]UPV79884.1 antitoxin YezG family protein [Bacillus rugosus]
METEKMGELYQQIAEGINEIIPSEWEKVILYAEILDDSSEVFFYFNPPQSEDYIYSHNIPEHFQVSEDLYDDLLIKLQEAFEELRKEYKETNLHIWTNLTLNLDITGQFSIDYNYEDVIGSELNGAQRKAVWLYKNLGLMPKRITLRAFLEDFIKTSE